jgi:hypothetical protein
MTGVLKSIMVPVQKYNEPIVGMIHNVQKFLYYMTQHTLLQLTFINPMIEESVFASNIRKILPCNQTFISHRVQDSVGFFFCR